MYQWLWASLSLTMMCDTLAVPQVLSYSGGPLPPFSSHNSTNRLLATWPPPPFQVRVTENMDLIFDSYGRDADPKLRVQVLQAVRDLSLYFDRCQTLGGSPWHSECGIVEFAIGFTDLAPITGANVSTALVFMVALYVQDSWSLREITSAQIKFLDPPVSVAAFQILFSEIEEHQISKKNVVDVPLCTVKRRRDN